MSDHAVAHPVVDAVCLHSSHRGRMGVGPQVQGQWREHDRGTRDKI